LIFYHGYNNEIPNNTKPIIKTISITQTKTLSKTVSWLLYSNLSAQELKQKIENRK